MLYLDGVYGEDNYGKTRFDDEHPCSPPYVPHASKMIIKGF
jgi:hypothetical protein